MKTKNLFFLHVNALQLIIIIGLISTTITSTFAQNQENAVRQRDLPFSLSTYKRDTILATDNDLVNLIISADTKKIADVERIYIRIIDPITEENIFVTTFDQEQITGRNAASESTKETTSFICKEYFSIDVGTFKKGEYLVYVKVKDRKNNVYFNQQKVIV